MARPETLTSVLLRQIEETTVQAAEPAFGRAAVSFLDYLAVSYQGLADEGTQRLLGYLTKDSGKALLLGQEFIVSPEQSALFNGFAGHVLDYDDVSSAVRGHTSTVIFPALLALVSAGCPSGRHFWTAYCIGAETMARFGRALGSGCYEKGFHNTSLVGVCGAAAAGGYLLGFSAGQLAAALGFAAAQAGGMRRNFGSEAKPLQAGFAAQKGVQAVLLAQAGLRSNAAVLDGPLGFFSLYGHGEDGVREILTSAWGENWDIVTPGLWYKLYPFCSGAYHTAEAAAALFQKETYTAGEISRIEIVFPPGGDAALTCRQPETGEQGKFSAEYVAAVGLLGLPYSTANFARQPVRAAVKQLMRKITRVYDAKIEPLPQAQPPGRFAVLRVYLKNKELLTQRCDIPTGSPGKPLTAGELQQKLQAGTGKQKAQELLSLVSTLQQQEDLAKLLSALQGKKGNNDNGGG